METLDLLIKKFREFKEELTSPLHDTDENLEKGFKNPSMAIDASRDATRAGMINKPGAVKPVKPAMPSPDEHASRASMYSDFMPQPKVAKSDEKLSVHKNGQWKLDKNVNGSYDASPNTMQMSEKLTCSENGQWNLNKDGLQDAIKNLKSSTKVTGAMNKLRSGPVVAKDETEKAERCSKCHASPCECQTSGINVD